MSDPIEEVGEYSEIADADHQEQVPEVGEMAEEPEEIQDGGAFAENAPSEEAGQDIQGTGRNFGAQGGKAKGRNADGEFRRNSR